MQFISKFKEISNQFKLTYYETQCFLNCVCKLSRNSDKMESVKQKVILSGKDNYMIFGNVNMKNGMKDANKRKVIVNKVYENVLRKLPKCKLIIYIYA